MKFSLNTDPTDTVRRLPFGQQDSMDDCGAALLCFSGSTIFHWRALMGWIMTDKRMVLLAFLMTTVILCGQAQSPSVGDYQSIGSGNWSDLAIWERYTSAGWAVPTAEEGYPGQNPGTDDVAIQSGHIITIDVDITTYPVHTLLVNASGILQYESATARTLSVSEMVRIDPGGTFRSALTGTVTAHQLVAGGSLVNNGTINFSTTAGNLGNTANAAGAGITFTGATNALFDLSGAMLTNLRQSNGLVLNKGTSASSVLSFTPGGTFQVLSVNSVGFLTIQNGTFSLMGENTFSNPLFYASTGSYTIPSTGGFRLDNPHATIAGMYGTLTNNGEIIIRDGVYNIGTGMGNELLITGTGSFEMSGGTMNISGRFRMDGGNAVISGGTINLAMAGHANQARAIFHLLADANLTISGAPLITITYPNSNTTTHYDDIEIVAGSGNKSITGGTFQLGTGNPSSDLTFLVNSDIHLHNLVVNSAHIRVSLSNDLTVNNQLTLYGRMLMNNYSLNLGAAAIAGDLRASHGMILTGTGQIHKSINSTGSYLFPFGNSSNAYLPVTLNFTSGSFAPGATVSVGMTSSKHPQNVSTTNYLNRYWTVQTTGITNPMYNFTGTYATGDIVGSEAFTTTGIYTSTWKVLSASNNIGTTIYASGLSDNVAISGINSAAAAPVITVSATPNEVCSGTSVQLTTTINSGISPYTYSWTSNPAGFTSTDANPIVNPTSTTTYTVVVTDASTETSTANVEVTVNPQLPVSVSIVSDDADNVICAGTSVTFTATPTNGGAAPVYQWYVGTTPVGTNSPIYTTTSLITGQIVTVVMTSTEDCVTGSPATSNAITTTVNPVLPVSVSIASSDADNIICAGTSVTFTATPTNGGTAPVYQWYVGTTPVGTNSPIYTTTSLTTGQIVTVVMTSTEDCVTGSPATSNAITTTVNPVLPVSVSIVSSDADNTICAGTSVTFTATPTNGGTNPAYQWRVNGNNVGTNSATYAYTPSNEDIVTCELTSNETCVTGNPATSSAVTMTVNPLPTATIAGITDVCQDAASPNITFTGALGTAPYTFTYSINGGANQTITSIGNIATVSVPTGTQNVFVYTLVSVQDVHCTHLQAGTATITVNPLPTITASSNSPQCIGSPLTLSASGGVSYSWTGPNGFTSTQQNPSIANVTTAAAGTYTVTVTDANGCVASASTQVIINPPPTVSITANPGNTICSGANVTFSTSVSHAGANPSYQWRINGAPVSGATSSMFSSTTLANTQQVTVIVTADPTYCSSTATSNIITMTVNPPVIPTVSILESGNNICEGTLVNFSSIVVNGGSAPAYQWQINETNVPGATSSSFSSSTLNNGDRVRVTILSSASCASPSSATSGAVTMSVNPNVTPAVIVSANPSTPVCPGTFVTFTATPTNEGSNPTYQWSVNGATVGSNSPTYTSSSLANNDVVSVRMTSNATCVSQAIAQSNNMTVSVNPGAPAIPASITGNSVVCPNITETYTISQVLNAASYTWTVPTGWNIQNGQGSNSITVTTGNTGANGSITVTATNSCGTSGLRTLAVSVGNLSTDPTGITISNNNTCSGTPKILTVTGGSLGTNATWQWFTDSCGGALAGTGASITVNPAAGTSTIYYVRASGTCNTTTCTTGTVIVSPTTPAQPAAINGTTPVCPGVTGLVYSIANVADATSYNWIVPAGWNITAGQGTTSITVTSGSAGQNGNISVTAVNSCGSSIARTLAVTVTQGIPATPGQIAGNSDQCINSTGQVYSVVAVPNATSYTWTAPTGWTITSGNGTNSITVSINGSASSGSISVVAGNSCGNSSTSILPVFVATTVPAAPGAISGLTAICPVKSVVYSVSLVSGAISYTWAVPTNWNISSGQGTSSITVQVPSNAASGNVTVTASNVCGNGTASTLSVTVANTAWVNAGIDQVVCQGTASITLNGSVGGAIKANQDKEWDWVAVSGGTFSNASSLSSVYNLPNNGNSPGVYTVRIQSNVSAVGCDLTQDEMTVTVLPNPSASIAITGNNPICVGSSSNVTFTGTSNTTVTYTVSGITGSSTINIGSSGTATLTTSALSSSTTYTLTNIAYSAGSACARTITGTATITVSPMATVSAGNALTICAGNTATMAGSLGGSATSGTWTSSGTGSFSNNTSTAVYTPSAADINTGTVTLTYTTNDPSGPCNAVSSSMVLTINPVAIVNAGPDLTICAGNTATMAGTFGGSAASGTWTTSGTGTFSNNSPTAVYTPSAADISAGTATITYTTNDPPGLCGSVNDLMILTINPLANVNAGPDQTVCASSPVTLAGTIGGAATIATWSGGTGSFSDSGSLTTVYTPSAEEVSDGMVTLTLTTNDPAGPCGAVSDQITITITLPATVNAGIDQITCEGSGIILSGNIGGAATSATWTTSGTGTFSPNNTTLNATYLPGNGETGIVNLTLTTNDPAGTCNAVSDQMQINISPRATVEAGPNQTICSNGTALMAGSIGGSATSGTWTTNGGGTFSNNTSPNAVYTPGNSDIFNGTVLLTFTTNDPVGPCGPVSASMTLTLNDAIQITSQPANTGVCATYPANLTVAAIGDNLTYQWYRGTAPGGTAVVNSSNISGAQSATLHFNNATSLNEDNYYVIISGANGCSPVISNTATLNVDQEITITSQSGSESVCIGENVTFNIVAEPGGLLTFQWRKDGVNMDGETGHTLDLGNVNLADAGNYDVLIAGLAGYTCSSAQSAVTTLTVNEDATITLTGGNANTTTCINTLLPAISYEIGGGGTGATITVGALPSGVTGIYNATTKVFTISGTPSAAGSFNYTVTTTGLCENSSLSGTISVDPNSTITLSSALGTNNQNICINTDITDITYTIGGSGTGASITAGALPAGVNGSFSAGVFTISGTPTAAGTYNYTVSTTGLCNNPSLSGTITVNPNSTITLSSAAATSSQTVCINNTITPITYTIGGSGTGASIIAGALPAGVNGSFSAGVFTISGTPTASGTFNYTVSTTGSCNNDSLRGTITVNPNSTITLSSAAGTNAQTGCINTPITDITYAIGGGATGATVTGLPAGVNSTYSGGILTISGTPTVAGPYPFTVTTTGSSCLNPSLSGTITINNNGTISLTSGNPNQSICINTALTNITYAVGGSATGVSASNLPPGVTGSSNSGVYVISGVPNTSGTYNFTLTTTGTCASGSITGTLHVDPVSVGGTLSPYNNTVCTTTNSGSLSLSGYTGIILRWESSTNAGATWTTIGNTTPTHNFTNLPLTTIFRAVVKSGACSEVYSAPARVVVIPFFEPIITATTVDVCNGNSTTLSVQTGLLQPVGAFTGGGFNQANPVGWRVSQNGAVISPFPAAGDNRAVGPWAETNGPRTFNGVSYDTQDNTKFTIVNGAINSTLETPVFNLFGLPSAELTFIETHNLAPGTTARVELSTDGGNSYNIVLASYTGSTGGAIDNPVAIDMSPYLGMMNLRIRFNYNSPGAGGWALDGISIPSQQTDVTYSWSPAETLSSTTDSVVIATPGTTTTYTLTMMVSGCPVIAKSIVIGVANPPTVQTTNACIGGGAVTFTQTGGTLGGTWRVSGGGTINAATGVFTPATYGCFNVSYSTPAGTCGDTVSFVVFPAAPTPIVNSGCGTIVITPPAAIPGFTLQYSFDNGATWGGNTPPTAESCLGYQIRTRYITTTSCDPIAQGATSTMAGCDISPAVTKVVDLTPPVITCPANVTANTNSNDCYATLVLVPPVVTDNCFAAGAITVTNNAPAQFPVGVTTVTWTAVDACGNQSTCTQRVTITDNSQAPVFTSCPGDQVQTALPGNCSLSNVMIPNPVASDNCTVTRLTWTMTGATILTSQNTGVNYVSGQTFNVGITTVTYIAYDAAGNASQPCSFNVWIKDLVKPVFTLGCPEDVTQDVDAGVCTATVTVPVPDVTDPCNESYTLINSFNNTNNASGIYPLGTTMVVWTITDVSGNTTTCTQTVTVNDILPSIICPSNVVEQVAADGCSKSDVTVGVPTFVGNCAAPNFTYTLTGATTGSGSGIVPSDQVYGVGVTTVTYTVTDSNNNSNSCSFTVTIQRLDIPPAVINCPASPTAVTAIAGTCFAPVIVAPPVEADPCATVTYTFINDFNNTDNASGSYPVGNTTVTWTITDNSGNTTTCQQTITVNDVLPTITCPPNVVEQIAADGCSKSDVTVGVPTFVGNCATPNITYTLTGATTGSGSGIVPSNQAYGVGVTTVTYTVTDSNNNSNSCSFTVTIQRLDIPPAVINCPANPAAVTVVGGTCFAPVIVASPVEVDPCATVTYTFINDFNNTDDASGSYPVGTTIVTWTITDNSGNTTTCQQIISVIDNQNPVIVCPASPAGICANSSGTYIYNGTAWNATATDVCGSIASLTYTLSGVTTGTGSSLNGVEFNSGTTLVTWTATDDTGNTETCSYDVTVHPLPITSVIYHN